MITLISVAGVAVGTAALVIALSLNAGFAQDVRERIHSGSAHLTILSLDHPEPFRDAAALVALAETVEGIESAAAVLYTPGLVTSEELGTHGFAELQGVEPVAHARVILGEQGGEGAFSSLLQPTTSGRPPIVLGKELAGRLGAREGDLVRVLVPQVSLAPWTTMPRSRLMEVVGTYSSDHFQEDATRAYLSIEDARRLLRVEEASSWIEVRLDDLRRLEPMKRELQDALPAGWLVVDLLEQNRDILRALRTEKLILFLAIGLIVVVASLNIVSTLILMVTDKVKEIGTLTAMGARTAGIARVFVLQGLVIGFVGTSVGLAFGASACWVLDSYRLIGLDPEVYYLSYIPFAIQPADLAFVGVASLAISLLATIYPATKASRLDPLEAIRHE